MADAGRRMTSFSFPLFIFFVSCHVVCLPDQSGGRTMEDLINSSSSPSAIPLPSTDDQHERYRRHQLQSPQRHEATGDRPSSKRLYPIFIDEPASVVVGASKSLILNCSYVSPTVVDVTWLLNGSALDSSRLDRLGIKISRYGVRQDDDYDGGDEDDDDDDDALTIRGNEDDDDDDDGVGDDDVIDKSGKLSSERRLGYYSNFGSHYNHNNGSNYAMYQDDNDDDDDEGPEIDGVDDVNSHNEDGDDDDGVLDVTNFRARDFPKQRLRHHKRKVNKRHGPPPDWSETDAILSDRRPDAKVVRKRETGNEESAILYQRPKSSIHKSLEILRIVSFNPSLHQGTYQCLLETEELGAMLSREARVVAATMTPFETIQAKTNQVVAYVGGTVVIPCVPPFSRPEAIVEFKVNGSKLDLTDRHLLLPSGNLQIWNVTIQDSSTYECQARNPVSNQVTQSSLVHSLIVIAPTSPQVTKYSRPHQEFVTAILGQNLTLECWAQGWPQPTITWEKYGGHLPKERSRILMGNLLIERVESNDVGTYLCKAGNDVGNQPGDKVFSVEVLEPPAVFVSPPIIETNRGKSVTINCKVEGAPRPTIQWWHNGQPMGKDPYQDSNLVLNNIKSAQSGTYQCFARNSLGVEQGFARLIVLDGDADDNDMEEQEEEKTIDSTKDEGRMDLEMPAPSKPEIVKTSNSSVKVKWTYRFHHDIPILTSDGGSMATPSAPSAYPLSFRIQYKEEMIGTWKSASDEIDLGKRSHEVKKLRTGAYRFRVLVNYSNRDVKAGPASVKVSMGPKPSLPVPIIVDLRPLNSTQMMIAWQIPADSWLPEGFIITYVPNDLDFEDASKKQINRADIKETILDDLEPGTQYKVRVQSYNSGSGKSAPSNTVVMKTPAGDGPPRIGPKLNPTPPVRFNGETYDQDVFYGGSADGSNPSYRDASMSRNYQKNDHRGDISGQRSGGSDKFASQSNLVYILLGSILCLIVTVVVAFLISCVIKRRRHEFGEKEKEKLKEKGIERLKQSSSMATTAPLLRSESTRPSGYPTSKSQTTLASQTFPSQTGIFQQNYQIKTKPSYTGSAMVGENNGSGQTESPFHHGSSMQPWTQAQSRPPHHQDAEKGQFYFQHAPEFPSDDQNHIYSTLEEPPLKNSPHSSCPSTTQPRFYSAVGNQDFNKDYPSVDHQLFHHDQSISHHSSIGPDGYTPQRIQVGRPTGQKLPINRGNNWYPADDPNSLTKEQATNTINTYYDNDPAADNGWSENAYSSLEGFSPAINQEQRFRDFSVDPGAISSADSSSTDSDFRVVGAGPPTSSLYQEDVDLQYPQAIRQKPLYYKNESIMASQHTKSNSINPQVLNQQNNFGHKAVGEARQSSQTYQIHSDRT